MKTLQASRFYMFCVYLIVWKRRSSKCTFLVSFRACHADRQTDRHTHTHTHTNTQKHTHKNTKTNKSLGNSASSADCTFNVLLSNMSSNLVTCKDCILQQSTNDWSDSDVKFWSGRNECAPLWREGSCARRNATIILRSQNKNPLNKLSLI